MKPTVYDQNDQPLISGGLHDRGTLPTSCLKPVKVRLERPREQEPTWRMRLVIALAWAVIIGIWIVAGGQP
jgi:hypothetical protein